MDNEERDSPPCVSSDICEESEDLVTLEDEKLSCLPDLEWLDELSEEENADNEDGDLPGSADRSKEKIFAKTVRMFKLRRNVDQLDTFHKQKEQSVLTAREGLELCRQNIQSLVEQREMLEKRMEQQPADNSVGVFRLRDQLKHLCQKLQSEKELEGNIYMELKQLEVELAEVEVELGRLSSLREDLKMEEQVFKVNKGQKAAKRLQLERKASKNMQLKSQLLRDKQASTPEEEDSQCQRKIEANHKIAAKNLKKTIERMHQQEAEKHQQTKETLERRTQAVKSLKSNIVASKESMQVQQSRAKAKALRDEHQLRQLSKSLQAQGTNSIKHMYQQKQLEERKREQEEFEERQKLKSVEIVAKILQEEQLVKRRKKHQALLRPTPTPDKLSSQGGAREKLLFHLDDRSSSAREKEATVTRDFSDSSSSSASSDVEDLEETTENHQSYNDGLTEPELSGLWDCNYKSKRVASGQTEVKPEEPPMPCQMLLQPEKKLHGKQIKGTPLSSKPEIILFKDFEVGKKYKRKVALTNSGHMTNKCYLLGVSVNLKNFLSISFKAPVVLCPGMSCDLLATFEPQINEDLEGEVQFASLAGPFSVPVRCTTKKCDLEVDKCFLDFGSHIVGQKISWTITLTNKGALATFYSIDTSPYPIPESHQVQMPPQTSANTCQVSSEKTASINQTDSASSDTVERQLKQESKGGFETQEQHSVSKASADPEGASEAYMSVSEESQMDQSHLDYGDISLGNVRGGEVGPFQSVKLEVVFTPTIPGEAKLDFFIKFSDLNSKPIPIQLRGLAASAPVWVVQPNIDFKICMFDHNYQDSITVKSRASTALKLTFEVCPELEKHMEVLPKTCLIQAQSSSNALLKFLPRNSLKEDAKEFYDSETEVLEVPLTVQVSGQVIPLHFTVQAIVTTSDIQFDRTVVDFGHCSIFQSFKSSVRLTNRSLLPQDFGFLNVPEFIEIQPNDGFGTLLPHETLEIDLIFSAKKAKKYTFQLNCKSGTNRDFFLSCRAVGFQPPVNLSHSLVQFGATAVGWHSTAVLHLMNHKASHTQSKQSVPSLDNDTVAPVDSKLYSFALPKDSDISISPSAGRLLPDQKQEVQVTFRPRLLDQEIKKEAQRLLQQEGLQHLKDPERTRDIQEQPGQVKDINKGKKTPFIHKDNMVSDNLKMEQLSESPNNADLQPGSQLYEKARLSLLYSFTQRYKEYIVPCYVLDEEPSEKDNEDQPTWSPLNTIYLKLQFVTVQPCLVILSNNGQRIVDFHHVTAGERAIKRIVIQNISEECLDLRSSLMDIYGPFSLLNPLKRMKPREKHILVVAFSPSLEKRYCETLEVHSHKMTLEMTLCGSGVVPHVTSNPPGGLLDFGYVLNQETSSKDLKLTSSSAVAVGFRVLLASFSLFKPQGEPDNMNFQPCSSEDNQVQTKKGTQSHSRHSVFSVVPLEGSIAPGQSQNITVTFQPDNPSANYSDSLTIELSNKSKVCVMDLKGASSPNNMYLCGHKLLTAPTEALLPLLIAGQDSEVKDPPTIPVLVTLQVFSSQATIPAVKKLQVGCIRSTQSSKKNGEFHWDDLASLQQQGFNVEPSKGTVESGHRCTITVTWTPHRGFKPYHVVQTCASLYLKGDEMTVYKVTLMASVTTTAD